MQSAGVLTSDYEGKQSYLDAEEAAIAAAVEIEDGQIVEIEGEQFIVKVTGERFSDPVKFKRVA
jgi:acetolactate synthase small subunit